jgi:hypothetical protein
MSRISFYSVVVAIGILSIRAFAGDSCSLISPTDAASLLGQPITAVTPFGPQPDEDSGGLFSFCRYLSSNAAVVVSVVEFASAAEARKQLNANLVKEHMESEDAKVTEEPGIGEQSFWDISADGASYTFVKGSRIVGIGLGGEGIAADKALSRKDALRRAALAVASKL